MDGRRGGRGRRDVSGLRVKMAPENPEATDFPDDDDDDRRRDAASTRARAQRRSRAAGTVRARVARGRAPRDVASVVAARAGSRVASY
jgi:hypothetical protein